MVKRFLLILAFSTAAVFSCTLRAHAALIEWDFGFDPQVPFVLPTETFELTAFISNSGSTPDGTHLTISDFDRFGSISQGDFALGKRKIYDVYDIQQHDLYTDLAGMNLAPGESIRFSYATLTPKSGYVPEGFYAADVVVDGPLRPNFQYDIRERALGLQVVPEPSSLVLLGMGLLGGGISFRRKRKQSC